MRQVVDVLGALSRALVDQPEVVRVRERVVSGETVIELDVAPEDRGRVIGRRGETIQSMRVLAAALLRTRGKRVRIEVAE
jgi:predicted RNA-binding protein YlqC (UPF0109 family)